MTPALGESRGDRFAELALRYLVRLLRTRPRDSLVDRGWPLHLARQWHETQPATASHGGGRAERPRTRVPRCVPDHVDHSKLRWPKRSAETLSDDRLAANLGSSVARWVRWHPKLLRSSNVEGLPKTWMQLHSIVIDQGGLRVSEFKPEVLLISTGGAA